MSPGIGQCPYRATRSPPLSLGSSIRRRKARGHVCTLFLELQSMAEPDVEMGPVTDEHDMLDSMDTVGVKDMYSQQVEQFDAGVRHFYDVIEVTASCVRRKYAGADTSVVVTAGDLGNFDQYQRSTGASNGLRDNGAYCVNKLMEVSLTLAQCERDGV